MPPLDKSYLKSYSFSDNTFWHTTKSDWRDRIEVEIGDIKEPDVILPQVKIMRWDNEANVSIRLNELNGYSVIQDGGKIVFGNEKQEAHFYELEEGEGGYETEVVLKEKPKTNVIGFTLVDKGVEYFYQPPLNKEPLPPNGVSATETDVFDKDGNVIAHRPENVVGSYAVYASENKVNYVGGKEYRCGKVGHIYRPKIVDAVGNEIWGQLNIKNGILSITIPQDFLDKAVYPVKVDPTFGYTTAGSSYGSSEGPDCLVGVRATGAAGTATSISAYFASGSGGMKGVLVLQSNKNIITNGVTAATTLSWSSPNWFTATYSTQPTISAVDYYICVIFNAYMQSSVFYDTGTGFVDSSNSYSSPTNPTDGNEDSYKRSIYCTYTAGGSNWTKSLSDSITSSDSPTKKDTLSKSDTTTPTDTFSRTVSFSRSPSDSTTLSDSSIRAPTLAKSDSVSLVDQISNKPGLVKSDSVGLTDQTSKKPALSKQDSVALSETISKKPTLSESDLVTISEAISKLSTLSRSELVALADSLSRLVGYSRNITDNAIINEEFSRIAGFSRTTTDSVAVSESRSSKVDFIEP